MDDEGRPAGESEKIAAHVRPGLWHLAFSVFVFNDDRELLLQRRSAEKYHFADRWSNSCCSHPAPSADLRSAAEARLREEVGVEAALSEVGRFRYEASDPGSSLIERELDVVFVGYVRDTTVTAHPDEVSSTRWVTVHGVRAELALDPSSFTPWMDQALALVTDAGHPAVGR